MLLPFDLVMARCGPSGPRAFVFANHSRMRGSQGETGPVAWTPFDVPWTVIMPTVDLSPAMRHDPGSRMPEIMIRQREHREPSLFMPAGRQMVGGAIEQMTISAAGIETRQVGGWRDEIGKPISGGMAYRKAWRRFAPFLAAVWMTTFTTYVLTATAIALLWR